MEVAYSQQVRVNTPRSYLPRAVRPLKCHLPDQGRLQTPFGKSPNELTTEQEKGHVELGAVDRAGQEPGRAEFMRDAWYEKYGNCTIYFR